MSPNKWCLVLIAGLFLNSDGLGADTEIESSQTFFNIKHTVMDWSDNVISYLTPAHKPTLNTTAKKITTGLGLLVTSLYAKEQPISQGSYLESVTIASGQIIGAKLLWDAGFEFLYLMYDKLQAPDTKKRVNSNKKLSDLEKEKLYDQLINQRNEGLSNLSRMCRQTLSLASSSYMIYGSSDHIISLIQEGINPFALSYPNDGKFDCPLISMSCMPVNASVMLGLNLMTVSHYWGELKLIGKKSFSKRGNVPLFSLISGLAIISLSEAYATLRGVDQDLMDHLEILRPDLYQFYVSEAGYTVIDSLVQKTLELYGSYRVYESAILLMKNLVDSLSRHVEIRTYDQPKSALSSQLQTTNNSIQKRLDITPAYVINDAAIPRDFYEEPLRNEHRDSKKEKVKTKGQQNINFDENQNKPTNRSPLRLSKTRKEGLDEVNNIRNMYPVKKQVIDSALKNLIKFLDARIIGIDGSEYKIVWTLGNKQYSLKYEVPHGFDHNNYSGNKLNRILNLLEVGYLIGLDEDQVQAYIEENNRYNLLRFPKLVKYLLLNPTQ